MQPTHLRGCLTYKKWHISTETTDLYQQWMCISCYFFNIQNYTSNIIRNPSTAHQAFVWQITGNQQWLHVSVHVMSCQIKQFTQQKQSTLTGICHGLQWSFVTGLCNCRQHEECVALHYQSAIVSYSMVLRLRVIASVSKYRYSGWPVLFKKQGKHN